MTRLNTSTPLPGSARSGRRLPRLAEMVRGQGQLPVPSAPGMAVASPATPAPVDGDIAFYDQMQELFRAAGMAAGETAQWIGQLRADERRLLRGKLTMDAQTRAAELFDQVRQGKIAMPGEDEDVSDWVQGLFADDIEGLDEDLAQTFLSTAVPTLTRQVLQHREGMRGQELANLAAEIGDIVASTTPDAETIAGFQADLMERGLSEAEAMEATLMPALSAAAQMGDGELFAYYEEQLGDRFVAERERLRNQLEVQQRAGETQAIRDMQDMAYRMRDDLGRPLDVIIESIQEQVEVPADARAALIERLRNDERQRIAGISQERINAQKEAFEARAASRAYELMRAAQVSQVPEQGFSFELDNGRVFEVSAERAKELATQRFYDEHPLLPPNTPVSDENLPYLVRNVQLRLKFAAENDRPDPQMAAVLSTGMAAIQSPDFDENPEAPLATQYAMAVFDAAYASNPTKLMEVAGESYPLFRTLDVVARWKHGGDFQKAAAELRRNGVMRRDVLRGAISHEKLTSFMHPKLNDRPWSFRAMSNGFEMMGDLRELTGFYMAQGLPQDNAMEAAWEDFTNRFTAIRGVWMPRDSRWNGEAREALDLFADELGEELGMDGDDIGFRTDPANPDVLQVVDRDGELITPPGQDTGVLTVTIGELRNTAQRRREEVSRRNQERIAREQLTRQARRVLSFGRDGVFVGPMFFGFGNRGAREVSAELDRIVEFRLQTGRWPKQFQELLDAYEADLERREMEQNLNPYAISQAPAGGAYPLSESALGKRIRDKAVAFWEWLTEGGMEAAEDRVTGLGGSR